MGTVTSIYRAMAIRRLNQKLVEYGELAKSSLQDLAFILGNHSQRIVEFLEAQQAIIKPDMASEFEKELIVEKAVLAELLQLEQDYAKLYKNDMSPVTNIC